MINIGGKPNIIVIARRRKVKDIAALTQSNFSSMNEKEEHENEEEDDANTKDADLDGMRYFI
jgi:hypothetical protein